MDALHTTTLGAAPERQRDIWIMHEFTLPTFVVNKFQVIFCMDPK